MTKAKESLPLFNNPIEFVKALWPMAEKIAQSMGMDPKILVAQAALETGWGKHISKDDEGKPSYNLFNIKADKQWDKGSVVTHTVEYEEGVAVKKHESFRQYKNFEESFQDYASFIASNPRYEKAINNTTNPEGYVNKLQQAGYATDPKYADKIMRIYHGDQLASALRDLQSDQDEGIDT